MVRESFSRSRFRFVSRSLSLSPCNVCTAHTHLVDGGKVELMRKNAATRKKMESHHIKKNSNTHAHIHKLNVDRILKNKTEKNGNRLESCSFIGLHHIILFYSFYFFDIFLNHFFSDLFLLLLLFFAVSLFRIYGLLVYSSSLYRSCALFRLTVFDDRPYCPSNCDGSIGTRNFSTINTCIICFIEQNCSRYIFVRVLWKLN